MLPLTAAVGLALAIPLSVPATASSVPVSATVLLSGAGDVSALAASSAQPRASRLARLREAMPGSEVVAAVQGEARAVGLSVDATTPWSLEVHGASSSLAALAGRPGVASVLRAGGPAPVPAAAQPLRGSDFRSAYRASAPKSAGAAATPIVATVQFAGWNPAELAGYAHDRGMAAPQAGVFTAVKVGQASTTARSEPGSTEVALDQESIFDTDPYAHQRAYFADPSPAGLVAALDRVAVDAQSSPTLTALSISWTWCFDSLSYQDALAMHTALATVVASGVSVFAASGDDGAYCGSKGHVSSTYPAGDPNVLAVGGSTLLVGPTSETGWGGPVPTSTRPTGFNGSGGGETVFDAPSWQAFTGDAHREVPDIAADADLATGFYVWHDSGDGLGAVNSQWGGTSLSSAVSAAAYADELASRGAIDGGLGDLHSSLYTAPTAAFRDVTTGTNGAYTAHAGYDMVTGLGAPQWSLLVDRLLTQPQISVPATLHSRVVPVTVSAPAGQTFLAWRTGYGTPPASCATSAGQPADPAAVVVPADGTFQIWAQGYVGVDRCFTVSTSTVVDTGHPSPPPTTAPPTTAPPTTAPPTSPPTSAPSTSAPPTAVGSPVTNPVVPGPPVAVRTDVTPPSVQVTARRSSLATAALSFSWRATDTSGVSSTTITLYKDGRPVAARVVGASGAWRVTGTAGHAYRLGLVAVDSVGNIGGAASTSVRLPYDDRSFTVGKGWRRASSRTAFDGSYLSSGAAAARAEVTVVGSAFSLLTTTGPTEGLLAVYVDGRHVRDVSLYSKAVHHAVAVSLGRVAKPGQHRISLVVKGKRAPHGKGDLVLIDGLLAA